MLTIENYSNAMEYPTFLINSKDELSNYESWHSYWKILFLLNSQSFEWNVLLPHEEYVWYQCQYSCILMENWVEFISHFRDFSNLQRGFFEMFHVCCLFEFRNFSYPKVNSFLLNICQIIRRELETKAILIRLTKEGGERT